jgi:ketosteroid isomerase-like protein
MISPEAVARYFEAMTPAALARLDEVYAEDAFFKDPFNEVTGLPEIRRIYEQMYEALIDPRFRIVNRVVAQPQAMFEWDFHFRIRRWKPHEAWKIHGVTHLRFGTDGRIAHHRDYWDTAEELYGKLPLIGGVMRFLRRRMG